MKWARALLAIWLGLQSAGLAAAEPDLLLEVVINGRPTGQVGEFVEIDGTLAATPTELTELGLVVPDALAASPGPIKLTALPGLTFTLNSAEQRLLVTAEDRALRPTTVGAATATVTASGPPSPTETGALLNYDLLGSQVGSAVAVSALLDQRVFGPWGVFSTGAAANLSGGRALRRLETAYTYYDPDELRTFKAGDLVTGSLTWSRPVRLAGLQLSSDFSLQPSLITYPLPLVSASASVPSTVDVLVNGIRQYNQTVQPGPFQVRSLPLLTGAGDIAVTVQDAFGRERVLNLPFYVAPELLLPDLVSYSVEAGPIRENFGLPGDRYNSWGAMGSLRYGLDDWITLESHAEGNETLQLGGIGAALRIGTLGVISVAGSGSNAGRIGARQPVSGAQGSFGISRRSQSISASLTATIATPGYRDLASRTDAAPPRLTLNANIAQSFDSYGALALAYVRQRGGRFYETAVSLGSDLSRPPVSTSSVDLLTATYSVQLTDQLGLFATGFKDLRGNNAGASFGLTYAFDDNISTSAGGTVDGGRFGAAFQATKPAIQQDDYGFNLVDQEGQVANRRLQGEYLARWGRVTAGLAQTSSTLGAELGLRGALTYTGGELLASDEIVDSFAVVSSGDVPGVPVLFENRRIGTTNDDALLLVPYLSAYQNNTIALDPSALPPDVQADKVDQKIRPSRRAGAKADFGIRRVQAALLRLIGFDGVPVPLGSAASVDGGAAIPIGYDGQTYVTDLRAENTAIVTYPDGRTCRASFAYQPQQGDVPSIEATCR